MVGEVPRPFLKSFAYRSTDAGAIPDALTRGFNVVVLVDVEETGNYPGCVAMSNLLPPPFLVYQILDTSQQEPDYQVKVQQYFSGYYAFLANPDREKSMVNLLASMYKTTHPILLYAELEVERQFHPLAILSQFMEQQFGILIANYENMFIQDQRVQPCFKADPKFIYTIIDLLFTNAYIGKEEYARMLPKGSIPSPRAIGIILSDFNYAFPTMEASIVAACNILDTYRYQAETGKFCPAIRVTQKLDEARQAQINNIVMNSKTRFGNKTIEELKAPTFLGVPPVQNQG